MASGYFPIRATALAITPTQITSRGSAHICAVDAVGRVWCWGDNAAGQIGDGTLTNRARPTLVLRP